MNKALYLNKALSLHCNKALGVNKALFLLHRVGKSVVEEALDE